ncbi:unnamed protein product [Adineta ricciae]|uniref:C2H2-type domain-containing protein n=1 Tax=Adineta ricciae TaxID=249248 RepID=A0A814REU3_ADIRI|nr:unnamed protein product [Adineta ricciae]CAF1652632.1 unnamed protein product [Adineta ricciae]
MTDNSSAPVDLRIKRKRIDANEDKLLTKKKPRHNDNEFPLDLTVKPSHSAAQPNPSTFSLYNPPNVLFNSSVLLYDLFLANLNAYCQQHAKAEPSSIPPPSILSKTNAKHQQHTSLSARLFRENSTASKHESYACSCGERYSNVAQLVSHLKITNHHAQLSSTHDEVAKLVRGQDIWLSRDTNPANQILKCLRCSLSFETLPDLTAHMMKTNHFTQLLPSSSTSYSHSPPKQQHQQQHSPTKYSSRSTCLVCSQQFAREVDLVDHLQRLHQIRFNCTTCGMYFENENLYKEHLLKEMHHRNGKSNRNRDYFIQQCRTLQKRSLCEIKSERPKSRSSIDREVERLTSDLVDRIAAADELPSSSSSSSSTGNALSLLQNFVIKQTPSIATFSPRTRTDLNNNCDDENSNQSIANSSVSNEINVKEDPLASLEKMLAYSTNSIELPSSSINNNGTKKRKFDKYRLFAEKMLRSTLS